MNARPHVLWIATHPIQYQAPVFRHLAASSRVTFEAAFLTRHGVESTFDPGFGAEFAWDIPLLDGYTSSFITNARHIDAPVAASAVVRFLATHPATLTVVSGSIRWGNPPSAPRGYPSATPLLRAGSHRMIWFEVAPPPAVVGDLNGDGEVNGADLGILLGNWGG